MLTIVLCNAEHLAEQMAPKPNKNTNAAIGKCTKLQWCTSNNCKMQNEPHKLHKK
jgi:hypothetical protein